MELQRLENIIAQLPADKQQQALEALEKIKNGQPAVAEPRARGRPKKYANKQEAAHAAYLKNKEKNYYNERYDKNREKMCAQRMASYKRKREQKAAEDGEKDDQ